MATTNRTAVIKNVICVAFNSTQRENEIKIKLRNKLIGVANIVSLTDSFSAALSIIKEHSL
jgi:hypothetical protein